MTGKNKHNGNEEHHTLTPDTQHEVGEKIEAFSQRVGSEIGTAVSSASDKAASYTKGARNYVEGHPVQSIVAAAATGLALGSLLTFAVRKKS